MIVFTKVDYTVTTPAQAVEASTAGHQAITDSDSVSITDQSSEESVHDDLPCAHQMAWYAASVYPDIGVSTVSALVQ